MTSKLISALIAVDDSSERRRIVDFFATTAGLKVLGEVAAGDDVLAAIKKLKPRVAILDAGMLEVAQAVQDAKLGTAIVLLSDGKDETRLNAAMKAGALGYVLKEKAFDELLACVRSVSRGELFVSPALRTGH